MTTNPFEGTTADDIDFMAQLAGIGPDIADMAKDILANGLKCDRCGQVQHGADLMGMFAMVAHSPLMNTPSPPTNLCAECGWRAAAFMGIQAAQERVDRVYGG